MGRSVSKPPAAVASSSAQRAIGRSPRSSRPASTRPSCPTPTPTPIPSSTATSAAAATTTDQQEGDLMLSNHTHERLAALGLAGMAKAFDDQQRQPDVAALTFEQRLGLMIDREVNRAGEQAAHRAPEVRRACGRPQSSKISICALRAASIAPSLPSSSMATGSAQAESAHHRANRRRQELDRLRARPQGMPRQSIRPLPSPAAAVRSSCARPRRRTLCAAPQDAIAGRSAHPRRLGPRPAYRRAASRSPRRSSTIDTSADRPSSPARCRSITGTRSSPTRPSPTPSSIGSSTMLTASHSRETACERSLRSAPILTQPKKPDPTPHAGNDTPAAFVGTGGRLRSECMVAFNRNPWPQSSESAKTEKQFGHLSANSLINISAGRVPGLGLEHPPWNVFA